MGIKHSATKASNQKGYASEWNAEHILDSNLDIKPYRVAGGEPVNTSDYATKNYVDSQGGAIINRKIYENYTQTFSSTGTPITFNIQRKGLIIGFLLKADIREDSGYDNQFATISLKATGTNLGTKYLTYYNPDSSRAEFERWFGLPMWGDSGGALLAESNASYTTRQINGFALLDMIDDITTFTITIGGSSYGNGWMKNIRCEILYF